MRYNEVKDTDDLSRYLDAHRGSGVSSILANQISDDMKLDDARAFSSFGDFLNTFVKYHATSKFSHQMTDDLVFIEVKDLISKMIKDPKYSDYHEFLEDRLAELKKSE